jgi:ABC-type oligopeptide transport system substrate-binding subunit
MSRKRFWIVGMSALILVSIVLASCSQEYYKTREGRAKTKYYNSIQFGADPHPKKKF